MELVSFVEAASDTSLVEKRTERCAMSEKASSRASRTGLFGYLFLTGKQIVGPAGPAICLPVQKGCSPERPVLVALLLVFSLRDMSSDRFCDG